MSGATLLSLINMSYVLFLLVAFVFVLVMLWQIRTNTKRTADKMDLILNALQDIKTDKNT